MVVVVVELRDLGAAGSAWCVRCVRRRGSKQGWGSAWACVSFSV